MEEKQIYEYMTTKKYKDNDTFNISVYSSKKQIYTIFKKCWESE